MFHQILQVHLFALLEEKEEPDPKEGISKRGGRGARRPTKEATSPNTIHSVGWDDHHRGQGGKLGEDTERPTRSGQETGCGGDGFRSAGEGANPLVFPWLSPCAGEGSGPGEAWPALPNERGQTGTLRSRCHQLWLH